MPGSYRRYDNLIRAVIRALLPKREAAILDVGPGSGKYSDILRPGFPNIDCIEVYEPYVGRFKLRERYRHCMVMDVRDYVFVGTTYRLVILGDVIEHLAIADAKAVLRRVRESRSAAIVAVPFMYKQGAVKGNEYEEHLQPHLTAKVVAARYPSLVPLVTDKDTGVYLQR